jgi:RNase H-like domain found in reverse transcriptase/Reverse transcriptase (RNA-dependent DNA polymerase)/Retroviral aspartyl protease
VYVEMADQKCTLMIDSGADISLFKCTKIPDTQIIYPNEACSIQGVTHNKTRSIGPTFTKLHIKTDVILEHKFQLVSEKFPIYTDGILGRDFLQKYKCIIDYDSFLLTINSEPPHSIPMLDQLQPGHIVIPARSEVIRRITTQKMKEPHIVLAQEVEKGVFCSNAVIDENAFLKFVNTTTSDIKLTNFTPKLIPISDYTVLNYRTDNAYEAKSADRSRLEQLLKEVDLSEVPVFAQVSIRNICAEFNNIFALSTDKLTINNFYEQEIRLVDKTPSFVKNYRIPHHQKAIINKQVQEMIENDVVESSRSPYNSPLLLVPKKGSKDQAEWRLVIDYRNINKKVIGDKFPLPRIEEILDQLGRAKYFSILDLKSGYHQIPVANNSRECTAFSTDQGHYQFKRLPFGLKISGNSFQRMMTIAMAGLTPEVAFLYVDDLVVFGCSPEHHNKNLIKVFMRLEKYNLKLNPKKCAFMQPSVTYLGHVISDQGIAPDPSKFETLLSYPVPENADDVRRFVAFCNYYRRFVPNFAELAQPLNSLLRKESIFKWNEKCQYAFDTLRSKLIQPPILQYPDFQKEFKLTTDASDIACGAILSQEVDGKDLPIAYASKAFNKGEKNKSTILKELTAIHWAVTFFKPYLFGKKFTIYTDHKPLIYLFSMKNPTSKLTRIRWDLEEFEYEVKYITGKTNAGADALSRIVLTSNTLEEMSVMAIQTRSCTKKNNETQLPRPIQAAAPKAYEAITTKEIKRIPELTFIMEEKVQMIQRVKSIKKI